MDAAESKQHLLKFSSLNDDDDNSDEARLPAYPPRYHAIDTRGPQFCHSPPPLYGGGPEGANTPTIQHSDGAASPQFPTPEGGGEEEFRPYARRWYILVVYSLVAALQGGVWNTYGPISSTVKDAFGWTDSTIALLSNWGPIAYLMAGIPMSWMLDVKGLRLSCVVTALFVAIGTGLRCITFDTPAVTWLTHVGQFFNGLGGPVAMAAPPILSAVWFPPRERTLATAVGTILNYMGVALSFITGPLLLPDVPSNVTNVSSYHLSDFSSSLTNQHVLDSVGVYFSSNESVHARIHKEKKAYALYMYIEAGISAVLLLLLLVYFPNKPPLPPCPSAAIKRQDFSQGLKHLFTCKQFWLVAMVYGVSLGTLNCWSSVLGVILPPYGISQNEAGWIGFYGTCSACVASLIVARLAGFFSRIMKWLILVSYTMGTVSFVVFTLSTIKVVPPSTVLFYVTIITSMTCLNAAVPLMFELSCELAYPTGEGTTNGVLTIVNNVFGLIFLFIMMIPDIGNVWTNWMVVGTSGICLPLLLMMKERYHRLEIDEHNPSLSAEIVVPPPLPPPSNNSR